MGDPNVFLKKSPDLDLAVIDYRLPDMSGIEVLIELKKIMPLIPVIFKSIQTWGTILR